MLVRIVGDHEIHCACFRGPHKVRPGRVVAAEPATNQPGYKAKGLLWVVPPDCPDYCYGILLEREDYQPANFTDWLDT